MDLLFLSPAIGFDRTLSVVFFEGLGPPRGIVEAETSQWFCWVVLMDFKGLFCLIALLKLSIPFFLKKVQSQPKHEGTWTSAELCPFC